MNFPESFLFRQSTLFMFIALFSFGLAWSYTIDVDTKMALLIAFWSGVFYFIARTWERQHNR